MSFDIQSQLPTFYKGFSKVGARFVEMTELLGGLGLLIGDFFKTLLKTVFPLGETVRQFEQVGIKSASLTNLIMLFTGLVIALQFIVGLERFGLQLYTGNIIGIAITRELGPVMTALMVAARVGAGITAELGSMQVTEQVDAIQAMGANHIQKLVVPRVVATTFCVPILAVVADYVGIFGGMLVTTTQTDVGARYFMDQITSSVEMIDFGSGIAKTFFFGFFIGIIACYQGLQTRGGTEGVGRATTYSVVYASIVIFISDFFLTKLFLMF